MRYKTQEMVVVTGTSSGIGRATAEQLAAEGFHVLAGVRRQEDADKIKQKISNRSFSILLLSTH